MFTQTFLCSYKQFNTFSTDIEDQSARQRRSREENNEKMPLCVRIPEEDRSAIEICLSI